MPRVSEQYRRDRRRGVVEAATDCFLAEGYRGASMQQIITATGLSAGAIYNHFPQGKSELVLACAQSALDEVFAVVSRDFGETFSPEQWLVGVLEALAAQPRQARLLLITWAEAIADAGVATAVGSHLEATRKLIAERFGAWAIRELGLGEQEAVEWVSMFSQAVLSVVHGWVVQSQLCPGFDHAAYLDYARTIAVVG